MWSGTPMSNFSCATDAVVAGTIRTDMGDYLTAFMLAGMLCLGAAIMVLFIGRGRRAEAALAAA